MTDEERQKQAVTGQQIFHTLLALFASAGIKIIATNKWHIEWMTTAHGTLRLEWVGKNATPEQPSSFQG